MIGLLMMLVAAAPPSHSSRAPRVPPCTPIPAIYDEWKAKTPWPQVPDSTLRRNLGPYRGQVTFDPFDAVIRGDSATRARLNERVLWEDDSVIVIVAKPAMPRDALVVPKREMMFPVDAGQAMLERLARVAAATSDAFISTTGKQCDASLASRIWVNPPGAIGVRHLHVHVQPPSAIGIQNETDFYTRMTGHLKESLSKEHSAGYVPLREASGVVRSGNRLLFAADGTPDSYFAYELQPGDLPRGSGPILSRFTVDRAHVTQHNLSMPLAIDLEGIALLPGGRPILVSERTHTLVTKGRWLADYPDVFSEIGNRGIEGVALRQESDSTIQVAVLWEGGFLERRRLPRELQSDNVINQSLSPRVCVHSLPSDSLRWTEPVSACPRGANVVELALPAAPDTAQRFRAADLIWEPDGDGFLVLLSSQNATSNPNVSYKFKWLQRFDRQGRAIDSPIDLCSSAMPQELRVGPSGNIEGLAWFEEGKTVVLVNDFDGPATVAIISLSGPWPIPIRPWECS